MKKLYSIDEAKVLIGLGATLSIAGEGDLLAQLPKGNWVGGTIPYFMSSDGGLKSKDKVWITQYPQEVRFIDIKVYSAKNLHEIPSDYPANGFSQVIVPAGTDVHQLYAQDCSTWPNFFDRPIIGWVSGVDLDLLSIESPKVFDGSSGKSYTDQVLVMHMELPSELFAKVNIINLFKRGSGDSFEFMDNSFEVSDCLVNGKRVNFYDYLTQKAVNTELPLVADYMGAMINVSLQTLDPDEKTVTFYAPVFPDIEYRMADPADDYEELFKGELKKHTEEPVFCCNCVLNYMYAKLEGKKTGQFDGPMTFGEIAYILLNQTLVYLTFCTKS